MGLTAQKEETIMLGRIAVHLDDDPCCERRIRHAAQLAAQHNAELVGIYASFRRPHVYEEIAVPAGIGEMIERSNDSDRSTVENMFRVEANEAGVKAFWRTQRRMPEEVLARESRYCDLLVMTQPDCAHGDAQQMARLVAGVILAAGRPVMLLPAQGPILPLGKKVVLCWDQGREAARALADATPIIAEASELTVLMIDPQSQVHSLSAENRQDLLAYCGFHDFPTPRFLEHRTGNTSVGEAILSAAEEAGADLIVMGAYGHSRLQQAILGGTTRKIFEAMRIPVLFSH